MQSLFIAAVLKMNKLSGNDVSIFVFLKLHQRLDYMKKESLEVNMVSYSNQAFN